MIQVASAFVFCLFCKYFLRLEVLLSPILAFRKCREDRPAAGAENGLALDRVNDLAMNHNECKLFDLNTRNARLWGWARVFVLL